MERIKKRKLKFPCIFGGNEESRRRTNIQSWSPDDISVDQNLCKFEVGKSNCRQQNEKPKKKFLSKGIPNGTSSKNRSKGILLKLMGIGGLFSAQTTHKQQRRLSDSSTRMTKVNDVREDFEASHVAKMKLVMKELMTVQKNSNGDSKHLHGRKGWKEGAETCHHDTLPHLERKDVRESTKYHRKSILLQDSKLTHAKTDNGALNEYEDKIECFSNVVVPEISESLHVPTIVTLHESEAIGECLKIVFGEKDRLTHSSSNMSELYLVTEAKNRIGERLKMTSRHEAREMASKGKTLGEIVGLVRVKDIFVSTKGLGMDFVNSSLDGQREEHRIITSKSTSFNDLNYGMHVRDVGVDADKVMVYSEPLKSVETFFDNDDPNTYRFSTSDIEDEDNDSTYAVVDEGDAYKTDTSSEASNTLNLNLASRTVRDTNPSWVDENPSQSYQLPGPDSEYLRRFKDTNSELLEAPPSKDVLPDFDCLDKVTSQLQEIRRRLQLLKGKSKSTSDCIKVNPTARQLRQQSALVIPKSVNRGTSFVTQLHQTSRIYGINPANTFIPPYKSVSRSKKSLFHEHIEQPFIGTSNSMLAYCWVDPAKRESKPMLNKNRIDQSFDAIYLDKDPDWSHPMSEIDRLGKVIGELVLNDLVLEFLN